MWMKMVQNDVDSNKFTCTEAVNLVQNQRLWGLFALRLIVVNMRTMLPILGVLLHLCLYLLMQNDHTVQGRSILKRKRQITAVYPELIR